MQTESLFEFNPSIQTAEVIPLPRKRREWIDIIIEDYNEQSNGKTYAVGIIDDEFTINQLNTSDIEIHYSLKYSGTNNQKPYTEIEGIDRQILNNIIFELYFLAEYANGDSQTSLVEAIVDIVLNKQATTRNRNGQNQTWHQYLKGLIDDKIKYKIRNYRGKKQRSNDDYSIDQLGHLYNLLNDISMECGCYGVTFKETL